MVLSRYRWWWTQTEIHIVYVIVFMTKNTLILQIGQTIFPLQRYRYKRSYVIICFSYLNQPTTTLRIIYRRFPEPPSMFIVLFSALRSFWEYFAQMETSPLPVKGCVTFSPMLGTLILWTGRKKYIYCSTPSVWKGTSVFAFSWRGLRHL